MQDVIFDGQKYSRAPNGYYFRDEDGKRIYLHRAIWEKIHGPIPEGYHVHHRDNDPTNNAPDDLELMSGGNHAREHMKRHRNIPKVCKQSGRAFLACFNRAQFCSRTCKVKWESKHPTEKKKEYYHTWLMVNSWRYNPRKRKV